MPPQVASDEVFKEGIGMAESVELAEEGPTDDTTALLEAADCDVRDDILDELVVPLSTAEVLTELAAEELLVMPSVDEMPEELGTEELLKVLSTDELGTELTVG